MSKKSDKKLDQILEELFFLGDSFVQETDEFKNRIRNDREYVLEFVYKYNVYLDYIDYTDENSDDFLIYEPMYFFSNNFGGYTIQGIKNSLKD